MLLKCLASSILLKIITGLQIITLKMLESKQSLCYNYVMNVFIWGWEEGMDSKLLWFWVFFFFFFNLYLLVQLLKNKIQKVYRCLSTNPL